MITALMLNPGEIPHITQIHTDGASLDKAVSIGASFPCSAALLPVARGIVAIYAYEGVSAGLPGNKKVGKRILAGTFYIVRESGGVLLPLTVADIAKYSYRFRSVEEYTDEEVIDSWFDSIWPVF